MAKKEKQHIFCQDTSWFREAIRAPMADSQMNGELCGFV